mmetsp:Transcript_23557/g.53886  ORF Transcript_23557/g.53886 Transcript_23557/m.53886 type:complete len:307 (-) Transcript_23557:7-927(-)
MMRANGSAHKKDMIVRTPKRFSGVMFSPFGLSIETREKMFRAAKARLESIAPQKESHVKLSSDTEARATPATIGMSERAVSGATRWPRRSAERPHVKTGSEALTICVKETAPAEAETTAPTWPSEWQKAIGARVIIALPESFGGLRMPVSHRGITNNEPVNRLPADWSHGSGSELSLTLFAMLYPVDKPNQRAKYTHSLSVRMSCVVATTEHPSSSHSARHSSASSSPHETVSVTAAPSPPRARLSARVRSEGEEEAMAAAGKAAEGRWREGIAPTRREAQPGRRRASSARGARRQLRLSFMALGS